MQSVKRRFSRLLLSVGLLAFVAGCNHDFASVSGGRGGAPLPQELQSKMAEKGMSAQDPILVRIFKKENELEVWKKDRTGQYALLKSYPICRWSGQLGPKMREGDRQAPEGFYTVSSSQMNPQSQYHLSFDLGYPNAFDRANGGSGSFLMVHGSCSSRGCYAMTDKQIEEIYALARESFRGGQKAFQVQALPFRMTPQNLAKHRANPHMAFWKQLKEGSDHFEVTKAEPKISVCNRRYVFNANAPEGATFEPSGVCPQYAVDAELKSVVVAKAQEDERKVAELVAAGEPAVKLVYADGHQHEIFQRIVEAHLAGAEAEGHKTVRGLGEVSRVEAIRQGPREFALDGGLLSKRSILASAIAPAIAQPTSGEVPQSVVAGAAPVLAPSFVNQSASVDSSFAAQAQGFSFAVAPVPEPAPHTVRFAQALR